MGVTLLESVVGNTDPSALDIVAAAMNPLRTRTEEGYVQERPISDLILAQQAATPAPDAVPWGIRAARVKYGSTTG